MGMIACVASVNPVLAPCAIKWVGRKGLSVKVITHCNNERGVDTGVLQIPDDSVICSGCESAIASIPRKPKTT